MTRKALNQCPGTIARRAFVRSGLVGLGGLALSDLLALEATASASAGMPARKKSVIVLWLWGGPSHMETFDLKPEAPAEYRGDFKPISTTASGIQICEHLPLLAKQAHRFSLIRSMHHDSPGHVNSTHTVLSAYPGELQETPPYEPKVPDAWAIINRTRGDWTAGIPPYIALPRIRYNGGAYLGNSVDPLIVTQDPNAASFRVPDLSLPAASTQRYARRASLLQRFDGMRRQVDAAAEVTALDGFQQRALGILTSNAAGRAFDISNEPAVTRDRYGRTDVGQRCLLARRLVEAGARIVTIDFPCVAGQKAFSWDDHASVWNIFEQMKIRLPVLDQVVSALIQDLNERGLQDDVLLVVMGEMGRTPKLSNHQGQPGREHWGKAMSVLLAGGGMPMGQVIGATNDRGEEPAMDPVTPNDFQATLYRYFGIPLDTHFTDRTGRPIPILPEGRPIRRLVG